MSDKNTAPEGGTVVTGGTTEVNKTTNPNPKPNPNPEPDKVSDHVQKVLKEKANWRDKALALEAQLKEKTEAELIEKEEYKTLLDTRTKELEAERQKIKDFEGKQISAAKRDALKGELSKAGLQAEYLEKLLKTVDLNTIQYDPENSVISGADTVAQTLKQEFTPLFSNTTPKMDHSAPNVTNGQLDLETWKKLPLEEKLKRKEEIYNNLGIKRTT